MNVNDNRLVNALRQLELKDAADAYGQMLAEPSLIESMSAEDLLLNLLAVEENARNKRRQEALLKHCKAAICAFPSDLRYDRERGAKFKEEMAVLLTMNFVKHGQNLTVFGGSGSGKTFIASLLTRQCCAMGKSAAFFNTKDLIAKLISSKGSDSYLRQRKSLASKSLLTLDDFGLTPYSAQEQDILFDILNDRYGRKSLLVTSQKTPDRRIEDMGGGAMAEAIAERIAKNNYTLVVEGDSLRNNLSLNQECFTNKGYGVNKALE